MAGGETPAPARRGRGQAAPAGAGEPIICAGCGQAIPPGDWDWTLILDATAVIYATCLLELDSWILGQ